MHEYEASLKNSNTMDSVDSTQDLIWLNLRSEQHI